MTKRKLDNLHFTIEGEFITEHFRALVREGNWRDALVGLKESLIGMTTDQAMEILSGRKQLVGVNTVDFIDDDKHKNLDWLREQYFVYFNRVILRDGEFLKPYGKVKNLCKKDVGIAMENKEYEHLPVVKGDENYVIDFNYARAETYLENPFTDRVFFSREEHIWLLCNKRTIDYPTWINKDNIQPIINTLTVQEFGFDSYDLDEIEELRKQVDWKNTVDKVLNVMEVDLSSIQGYPMDIKKDGYPKYQEDSSSNLVDSFLDDMRRSGESDEDSLRKQITEKANSLGGWLEVTNPKTNVEYKIPKNAFYRWVLSDSSAYCQVEWGAVSPRGYKMGGDDPNHTDWWLFTNLAPSLAHETSHPEVEFFYNLKDKTYRKLTKANITPLSRGDHKGFERAKVVIIDTPDKINHILEDSVVVIPKASPEFELVAIEATKKNCILISETGGKLCHLAIVGREFGICLYMLPNAINRLPPTSFVKINTDKDQLDIQHMDIEQNLKLKISGFLYK